MFLVKNDKFNPKYILFNMLKYQTKHIKYVHQKMMK